MFFFIRLNRGGFMLKRICQKRIILSSAVLFALLLLYLIPKNQMNQLEDIPKKIEYVDQITEKSIIYLLDCNEMVARTKVVIDADADIETKAKGLLNVLIQNGEGESKVPNGFRAIIPSDTKILSIHYEENVIKVDFSKELLEMKKENEEKVIEAIIYTLTNIEDVKYVIIYVEGDILTKLPHSGKNLPSTLDRSYGINKEYDLQSYKDVTQVTVYYIGKYNDETYYIPVTKYLNDDRDKIKIIIDELASSNLYTTNLMSFLNSNTKLLATEQEVDSLFLTFNSYIFNDMNAQNILEEVIYTISLSVGDNYDVKEVVFEVEDQEIYKSVIKTIE